MNFLTELRQDTLCSLELLEQINLFRKQEGNRTELQHKTLLEIIRDEFSEEIGEQKILPSSYKNFQNKEQPMFKLTLSQARQVLIRESKFVRKAVVSFIDGIEEREKEEIVNEYEQALLTLKDIEKRNEELEYLTGDGKYLKAIPCVKWLRDYFWMDKNGVIPRLVKELILLSNERRIPYDSIHSRVFGGDIPVFHIDIYRTFKENLDADVDFKIMSKFRRLF
ncbi:Rha family transcriptional regulator [Fusobacterium varium]|uniref:Rha family transcriptional regulator n=1 Tax=Fusobacterium varium TaxID=856 RepID=UPI001F2B50D2|nr:Rha family transcriptional regulator [Fusobacterium varium]MCF2674668.1 hypothetical protein [Fusobacterium varium]UYI78854.1 MAG: Rha family transcriptional regulator [Fusobacterium varium]